ncbi:phospholipase A1-like [Contarinia nasturtii]|uniref:phospholipase A1-like n=1 Tax=Contarinia nasturtii TaxID=265458 RepID=UPI0012D3D950|nr:phospholipase A1-like [Contarinia nasturtii]
MIIFVYTIIFAAFLDECFGVRGGCCTPNTNDDFDIDDFKYQGDPIRFSCITAHSQSDFYMTDVNGSIPAALVERLNNGNGLSLFFHGAANVVHTSSELLSSFANEWFKASGNNICIVTYAYTTRSSRGLKMYAIVNEMVKTRRLEYVAKMAGDLVAIQCLNVSQVDVSGFSFGAHVAGRTSQYLLRKTGERVRILLALDPIKPPLFGAKIRDSIKRGYANYVQVIHTSRKLGIWDQMGDVDVYVKYEVVKNLGPLNDEHGLAFFIHLATATKRLFIAANLKGDGNGNVMKSDDLIFEDECVVGVYGGLKSVHRGKKLVLLLGKRDPVFWDQIGMFRDAEIFLGSQEVEKEEKISDPNGEECVLCFENKKNVLLKPCKHKEICNSCWNKWKIEQFTSTPKCPICRREVTKSEVKK